MSKFNLFILICNVLCSCNSKNSSIRIQDNINQTNKLLIYLSNKMQATGNVKADKYYYANCDKAKTVQFNSLNIKEINRVWIMLSFDAS